ncbi:MAG: DUF2798 domain-containing protein [Pseudomonadota bacterium]
MFPARFAPYLFGLILSGMMSFLVSGIATWRAVGMSGDFVVLWLPSWLNSWAVAFPTLLVVRPFATRLVGLLVRQEVPGE